ncbi:30S ribosomal protein S6 [Bacteroidia bacterium]|jgi:small subunit ribosomal protein S6|nr:30S ribosomal protein S6 [Bacteroidia bacterium]
MNQKQYETVIILTPVLSEQQMKDAVAGYRELITENGGEMIHEENWGLTKLAYPIEKKGTGFYHLFEFKANTDFITKWELAFRRDERVMRSLTTSLDKWAIEFNQKRRSGEIKSSAETAKERKAAAAAAESDTKNDKEG